LEQNYVFTLSDLEKNFELTAKTNVGQITETDPEMTETNVKKIEVDLEVTTGANKIDTYNKKLKFAQIK